MTDFRETSKLAPVRLGPTASLGYFRPLDGGSVKAIWIVENERGRAAIILEDDDPKNLFKAFPLEDYIDWTGLSFGAVEVLVNVEHAQYSDVAQFGRGLVTIAGGKVYISAVPRGQLGARVTFDVGTSAPSNDDSSIRFSNWRLVQRRHDGSPEVLFEQGA